MQALTCIPFAIASTKIVQVPSLTTTFELRAYRYELPARHGDFITAFGSTHVVKSDLDVFLTRPAGFEVSFDVTGTLEPRKNRIDSSTEFALDLARVVVPARTAEVPMPNTLELRQIRVNQRDSSLTLETSVSASRIVPRVNAIAPTTEFGLIATRRQI